MDGVGDEREHDKCGQEKLLDGPVEIGVELDRFLDMKHPLEEL